MTEPFTETGALGDVRRGPPVFHYDDGRPAYQLPPIKETTLMGQQIIKQPDGLFAVFSSITDTFTFVDGTAEEVVEFFAEQAARDARRKVGHLVRLVAADQAREAYFQFAMTWDAALRLDREHGGEVHLDWGLPPVGEMT